MAKNTSEIATQLELCGGIWPPLPSTIRRLEDAELDVLMRPLARPASTEPDREWLRTRFVKLVADIIRLSDRPSPRERRDSVVQLAAEGRRWLQHMDQSKAAILFETADPLPALKAKVVELCDALDGAAARVGSIVKRGQQQSPRAMDAFVYAMLEIAGRFRIPPSTPVRSKRPRQGKRRQPNFFDFVRAAHGILLNVIETSDLEYRQKLAARSDLSLKSSDALVKAIEKSRREWRKLALK